MDACDTLLLVKTIRNSKGDRGNERKPELNGLGRNWSLASVVNTAHAAHCFGRFIHKRAGCTRPLLAAAAAAAAIGILWARGGGGRWRRPREHVARERRRRRAICAYTVTVLHATVRVFFASSVMRRIAGRAGRSSALLAVESHSRGAAVRAELGEAARGRSRGGRRA